MLIFYSDSSIFYLNFCSSCFYLGSNLLMQEFSAVFNGKFYFYYFETSGFAFIYCLFEFFIVDAYLRFFNKSVFSLTFFPIYCTFKLFLINVSFMLFTIYGLLELSVSCLTFKSYFIYLSFYFTIASFGFTSMTFSFSFNNSSVFLFILDMTELNANGLNLATLSFFNLIYS